MNFAGIDDALGFTGHTYDLVLDKVFAQARFYDPDTSRMLSEDTYWNTNNMLYGDKKSSMPDINAIRQSTNLYVYCMNNPINYIDTISVNTFP